MKRGMLGTRNQAVLFSILVVGLAFMLLRRGGEGRAAPTAEPPAQAGVDAEATDAPARSRRGKAAAPTAEDVQFLNKEHLAGGGGGETAAVNRNLFDFREPTPVPPPPPVPTRTIPPMLGPPPPTWTPGPTATPVPPEIPFRFLGSFGSRENPIATLVAGDRVVNARVGEVVFDHFVIRKVGYESLDVGYVRYPPSVMRRLPIAP